METLFAYQRQLLQNVETTFVRSLMDEIDWEGNRLVGIRGARGVGKTTLMLQYVKLHYGAETRKAVYLNLDNPYFLKNDLMDVVQKFYQQGGERLLLDEVHKYPRWSQYVKSIYDSYPTMKVAFTGSSLIQILNAEADLSRRCVAYEMQGLSFREYMQFYHGVELPLCGLDDILHNADAICSKVNGLCRPLAHFADYLRQGYYPFMQENPTSYRQRIEGVVDMILGIELPQQRGVDLGNLRKLKSLVSVVATEVPMLVDVSKMARTIELNRVTLLAYMQYLHDAKLIRLVYSDQLNVKRMQKPDKIMMENPNLCEALNLDVVNEGSLREVFFCNQVAYRHRVEYTNPADFLIDRKYTVEIGGSSKDGGQIAGREDAYLACDGMEYAYGNKLPLWIFGLLY